MVLVNQKCFALSDDDFDACAGRYCTSCAPTPINGRVVAASSLLVRTVNQQPQQISMFAAVT